MWLFIVQLLVGRRTKPDTSFVLQDNLKMFFNLMNNKNKFDRLINFSSGADFDKTKNVNINNHNLEDSYPINLMICQKIL